MSPTLRTLAAGLLCLAACSAPPTSPRAAEPVEVTLLTYNIHHGRGADGVIDLERQAAVILATGADLVALQEVDVGTGRAGGVDQATELARLTGMHHAFAEAMPYDGGSYGEALLSRWPLDAAATWPLPASPGHEPRAAVVARVTPPGHAGPLRVVGTHLDHTADDADRLAQVTALLGHLARATPADLPTVLLGDLNARPDSAPMARLLGAGWTPADGALGPTYPAVGPDRKIDWILAAPGPVGGTLTDAEVLVEPLASDHAPLRAVWRP